MIVFSPGVSPRFQFRMLEGDVTKTFMVMVILTPDNSVYYVAKISLMNGTGISYGLLNAPFYRFLCCRIGIWCLELISLMNANTLCYSVCCLTDKCATAK